MAKDQEQTLIKRRIPIRDNPMKSDQITGYRVVSSGPLPTFDELPPLDGSGKETIVEGSEVEIRRSSTFPGEPRQLPIRQKGVDLDK